MSMKENHMTTIYLIRHAEAEGNLYRIAHRPRLPPDRRARKALYRHEI